jgi:hypothetical protein
MTNVIKLRLMFIFLLGLIGYIFSIGFIFLGIILALITYALYSTITNNLNRKEPLNILKQKNTLYFFLSDDYLFSTTLNNSINNEIKTIKSLIKNINFINFENDNLQKELNRLLY